ncbi:MAG: dihydrodipicolinate synthase family protein [Fimbriimonas sp.]|nr:dihydrodipicolinate synthase family protein [Fimbriimonas sp.]
MKWTGVIPAITTQFHDDLTVDHGAIAKHVTWLVDNGCTGILALGSLGEGATLRHDEKLAILSTCVETIGDRVPVVAGISALSTAESMQLAKDAQALGCQGLMVLPAYVYKGDWRETRAHFNAVFQATSLSCMLYNNPIAYAVDVLPEQLAELAESNGNLHSVKESSTDVRRVTAIRHLLGDRMAIFVGVDDLIVEAIPAGAVGWIAGLVNAFPKESVELFDLCTEGRFEEASVLYKWFLPLLKLDVVPKFVQLIKLTQQEVGMGSERVRPPRLELVGQEREQTLALIRDSRAARSL